LLTHEALDLLCSPSPHPQHLSGPELSPLERFLGCVYMRRQLQRFIQNEDCVCIPSTRKCFWVVKSGWRIRPTPSLIQLSRKCGILNFSQAFRPPQPVMEIALLLFYCCSLSWYKTSMAMRMFPHFILTLYFLNFSFFPLHSLYRRLWYQMNVGLCKYWI
jgi:hypothetical protein